MGIGLITDMKFYEDNLAGGYIEKITQNINAFNAASNGCLVLRGEDKTGDYAREAFWKLVSGMSRRDDTSTAGQTPQLLTQDENITVKLKHKFDQFAMTEDAFYSAGRSPDEFAFVLGQQMADQSTQYTLNRLIASINAALSGVSGATLDVSGAGSGNTLSPQNLNKALALYGDQQARVVAWVMAGAGLNAIADKMLGDAKFNDSGISIYNGGVPTLGRPVLTIDTDVTSTADGKFQVFGLVKDAGVAIQSEPARAIFERKGGLENIVIQGQAEGAFNLGVKGFKWVHCQRRSQPQ